MHCGVQPDYVPRPSATRRASAVDDAASCKDMPKMFGAGAENLPKAIGGAHHPLVSGRMDVLVASASIVEERASRLRSRSLAEVA